MGITQSYKITSTHQTSVQPFQLISQHDTITILESAGPLMTKTWGSKGIQPYDKAYQFKVVERNVGCLNDVAGLLQELEKEIRSCMIRGKFIGQQAAEAAIPALLARDGKVPDCLAPGNVPRKGELFNDQQLHSLMLDVDGFRPSKADPIHQPEAAAIEFIRTHLPPCFHHANFYWSLSGSAGAPGNEGVLKAHLWFWLKDPYTSTQLRAWAETVPAIDKSLYTPVQLHYTAAPHFEPGTVDPAPVRSGFYADAVYDDVALALPSEILLRESQSRNSLEQARDPKDAPGLVGAFCRKFGPNDLATLLPDEFKVSSRSAHFDWIEHIDGGIKICGESGLMSSHNSAPTGTNQRHNVFDFVRLHQFGHLDENQPDDTRMSDRPSWKAMEQRIKQEFPSVIEDIAPWVRSSPEEDFGHLTHFDAGSGVAGTPSNAKSQNGPRKQTATVATLAAVLRNPEACGWRIGFDKFEADIKVAQPGANPPQWENLGDTHYTVLREHIERSLNIVASKELMRDTVDLVARENEFDSAQQWLNALVWDNKPRIDSFLENYCTAAPLPYHQAVSRYIWTALAGRVLSPGLKADMVPVLIGVQGCRKTSLIEAMAVDPRFFGTVDLGVRDDDTARKIRGKLVLELSELQGLGKRDAESLKAFISATQDCWIEKYKERQTSNPRRGLFLGSTNREDFLQDATGHRRWLPVRVGSCNPDAARADCEQPWAEAMVRFLEHGLDFAEAEKLAEQYHADYVEIDPWTDRIQEAVDELSIDHSQSNPDFVGPPKPAQYRRNFVTVDWVLSFMGDRGNNVSSFDRVNAVELSRRTPQIARRVSDIMIRLGWGPVRKREGGRQARGFERPAPDWNELGRATLAALWAGKLDEQTIDAFA